MRVVKNDDVACQLRKKCWIDKRFVRKDDAV